MKDEQILDIFYKQIVKEAINCQVDCYFMMNIGFNLIVENKIITKSEKIPYQDILMPTLKISNKKLFDNLLIEYVKKSLEFYEPSEFEFLNDINNKEEKTNYLIKYIICTLLANASYKDFDNPICFLQNRIKMFDNKLLSSNEEIEFGYLDTIKASLYIKEDKSSIKTETPYKLQGYLIFDDGYKLILPNIYYGINDNKCFIYSIQKLTEINKVDERNYLKQIRKGLIAKINGAPEHYFLAVMLLLSLCQNKEIEVIPLLIERWNAKRIAINTKSKISNDFSLSENNIKQDKIQYNVTDILIRYFTKLEDVTNGLDFVSIPTEIDDRLHIKLNDNFQSRSILFNELIKLSKKSETIIK